MRMSPRKLTHTLQGIREIHQVVIGVHNTRLQKAIIIARPLFYIKLPWCPSWDAYCRLPLAAQCLKSSSLSWNAWSAAAWKNDGRLHQPQFHRFWWWQIHLYNQSLGEDMERSHPSPLQIPFQNLLPIAFLQLWARQHTAYWSIPVLKGSSGKGKKNVKRLNNGRHYLQRNWTFWRSSCLK